MFCFLAISNMAKFSRRRASSARMARTRNARKGSLKRSRRRWSVKRKPSVKRWVLNTTSNKKRDTMVPFSGDGEDPNAAGATLLVGNGGAQMCVFNCTARAALADLSGPGFPDDIPARGRPAIYARGFKDSIRIQTASSMPWAWRRIVFVAKGEDWFTVDDAGTAKIALTHNLTSNGYVRYVAKLTGSSLQSAFAAAFARQVFAGTGGVDWLTPINAPTSSERVTILSDHTTTIKSGNDAGVLRTYQRWHPINRTIIYGDKEDGGRENTADISSLNRHSFGDVYIMDIFEPHSLSSDGDNLSYAPTGTFYWHER